HRKLPHNRVCFRRERDRRVVLGPRPAPVVPDVYRDILDSGFDVAAAFRRARHGVPPDQVKPLGIPLETITQWYARREAVASGAPALPSGAWSRRGGRPRITPRAAPRTSRGAAPSPRRGSPMKLVIHPAVSPERLARLRAAAGPMAVVQADREADAVRE